MIILNDLDHPTPVQDLFVQDCGFGGYHLLVLQEDMGEAFSTKKVGYTFWSIKANSPIGLEWRFMTFHLFTGLQLCGILFDAKVFFWCFNMISSFIRFMTCLRVYWHEIIAIQSHSHIGDLSLYRKVMIFFGVHITGCDIVECVSFNGMPFYRMDHSKVSTAR